ncbi:MAG: choline-sulfatase [Rhodothermales bacterium]|jgi:choline-sulfatase
MSRQALLPYLLLFSTIGALAGRPNVIVIVADDHPTTAISAYGSQVIQTPNIDQLAAAGARFDSVFCVNSICGPSRSSILTGTYPHVHGVVDNYHQPDNRRMTYPERFVDAGYQAALFGKTHFKPHTRLLQRLDHYQKSNGVHYHNPSFLVKGRKGVLKEQGYITDILTDRAIDWVKARDKERPFLLMLHHPAAHMPFHEPDALKDRFAKTVFPAPASFDDPAKNQANSPRPFNLTIPGGLLKFQGRKHVWGDRAWTPPSGLSEKELKHWTYQRLMRAVASCVTSIDDNLGRLVAALKADGTWENTIVLYTADQGFFLGEHGFYDKRMMYDAAIRMPLILRVPGAAAGQVFDGMILNVDFAPTLLEIAGIDAIENVQGRSFAPLLQGRALENWRTAMYYHYHEDRRNSPLPVRRHYGIRTGDRKLIRFYGGGKPDQWELYNLATDPDELTNQADNPEYGLRREQLTRELDALRKALKDTVGPAL